MPRSIGHGSSYPPDHSTPLSKRLLHSTTWSPAGAAMHFGPLWQLEGLGEEGLRSCSSTSEDIKFAFSHTSIPPLSSLYLCNTG